MLIIPSFLHRGPGLVGVELLHLLCDLNSIRSEVLLVDLALLIDDKGHYPGLAPIRGECDQGEAADHVAIDDVIVFSPGAFLPCLVSILK